MSDDPIDAATFAELQDTAGAEFVSELIGTFLEEAPQMLAELRSAMAAASAERVPPRSAFHQVQRQHLRRAAPGRNGACAGAGRAGRRCRAGRCTAGRIRAGRRRVAGAGPWLMCPQGVDRRRSPAGRRRQQGQPAAARAQPGAAGPPRGQRRKRPRRAGDAEARALRPAAAGHGNARDGRLPGAGTHGRRCRSCATCRSSSPARSKAWRMWCAASSSAPTTTCPSR